MEYSCIPLVLNEKVVSINISATETNGSDIITTPSQNWPIATGDQKALSAWSQSDLDTVTAAAASQYGWVAFLDAELTVIASTPKQGKFNF